MNVTDVINDDSIEPVELAQLHIQCKAPLGGQQSLDQLELRGELYLVAEGNQLVAYGAREVGLATARQLEAEDVLCAFDNTAIAEGGPIWSDRSVPLPSAGRTGCSTGQRSRRSARAWPDRDLFITRCGPVELLGQCFATDGHPSGGQGQLTDPQDLEREVWGSSDTRAWTRKRVNTALSDRLHLDFSIGLLAFTLLI